jgi:hypothetical protein
MMKAESALHEEMCTFLWLLVLYTKKCVLFYGCWCFSRRNVFFSMVVGALHEDMCTFLWLLVLYMKKCVLFCGCLSTIR